MTGDPDLFARPICGTTVAITADALCAEHDGRSYYFCASGCRRTFVKDPAGALSGSG